MNDSTVSRQWFKRPDDERYLTIEELHAAVASRAENSTVRVSNTELLKAYGTEEGELVLQTEIGPKFFTHWSFGQTASLASAPGSYLRKLSSPLAAACLNEGLAKRDEIMLLANGDETLRAVTSPKYGRIWDKQVVEAVQRVTYGGTWKIPASSYASRDPKKATTLYASDRDVFIFLVDEEHPVDIDGETLFRGFYTWNSEVGSQVFGLATFLYRYVCDNRIIWGMSHKNELRIRHSAGAPERFALEGKKALVEYSQESTKPLEEMIHRAKAIKVGNDEEEVKEFLKKRGFTVSVADAAIKASQAEDIDFRSPWALAQGITAYARDIKHTDTRVDLERQAGKLLASATQ
jgi:Domain of unknown function (DUF932)